MIDNIITPKLMDLGFSIVSDILFITKHKNDNNFGPNLNIDINYRPIIDSPGHMLFTDRTLVQKTSLKHMFNMC